MKYLVIPPYLRIRLSVFRFRFVYIYIYIGELVGRTREFGGKLFEDERVDARKGGGRERDTKGETKRGRGKNLGEG